MKETNGFAERLAELRTFSGIYQKELAGYLNVSIGTVSNYEKGIHQPDLETLCKLADYYGVSTDYLLGRTFIPLNSSSCHQTRNIPEKRLKRLFERILQMSAHEIAALELLMKIQNKYQISITPKE